MKGHMGTFGQQYCQLGGKGVLDILADLDTQIEAKLQLTLQLHKQLWETVMFLFG